MTCSEHAGDLASIALDGTVLAGSLPARAHHLVREWAQLHNDETRQNWQRARSQEALDAIPPLPSDRRMSEMPPLVRVTRVEAVGDHRLRLSCEDGMVGDVSYEGASGKACSSRSATPRSSPK
jgi:hypothetical protein